MKYKDEDAVRDVVYGAVEDAVHGVVYGAVEDAVRDVVKEASNGSIRGAVKYKDERARLDIAYAAYEIAEKAATLANNIKNEADHVLLLAADAWQDIYLATAQARRDRNVVKEKE